MIYRLRKSPRFTSYNFRYGSISVKEARHLKTLRKAIFLVSARLTQEKRLRISSEYNYIKKLQLVLYCLCERYFKKAYFQVPSLKRRKARLNHTPRTIQSISEADSWKYFRTRKVDLSKLLVAFKLNREEVITVENGSKFTAEEILLIGLFRYCCAGSFELIARPFFKLEFSMLSRAFKFFNSHMLSHFSSLLTDNLAYWKDSFPLFASSIAKCLLEKGDIHFMKKKVNKWYY
jgi:hypothetical protein